MELLVKYMYTGQVSVTEDQLVPLVQAAKGLSIKGLLDVPVQEKSEPEPKAQTSSPKPPPAKKPKPKPDQPNTNPEMPKLHLLPEIAAGPQSNIPPVPPSRIGQVDIYPSDIEVKNKEPVKNGPNAFPLVEFDADNSFDELDGSIEEGVDPSSSEMDQSVSSLENFQFFLSWKNVIYPSNSFLVSKKQKIGNSVRCAAAKVLNISATPATVDQRDDSFSLQWWWGPGTTRATAYTDILLRTLRERIHFEKKTPKTCSKRSFWVSKTLFRLPFNCSFKTYLEYESVTLDRMAKFRDFSFEALTPAHAYYHIKFVTSYHCLEALFYFEECI